jgi:hypothetical protein
MHFLPSAHQNDVAMLFITLPSASNPTYADSFGVDYERALDIELAMLQRTNHPEVVVLMITGTMRFHL